MSIYLGNKLVSVYHKPKVGLIDPDQPFLCEYYIIFNSDNTSYELPEGEDERQQLLLGAYIELAVENTANEYRFDLTSLSPDNPTRIFISSPTQTNATVRVHLNNIEGKTAYAVPPHKIVIKPNTSNILYLQTQKVTSTITFYERVQIKGEGASVPNVSYRRKRTVDENGIYRTYFGGFASDGVTWIDKSMTSMRVYTGVNNADTGPTFTSEVLYDGGGGDDSDLGEMLKNEFGLRKVDVVVHTRDEDISNDFMQINKVYTSTRSEIVGFPTYNDDGTIASITEKECIVTSITSSPNQPGYHLHSAFIKIKRNHDTNTFDFSEEMDHAYFACYRTSSKSVKKYDGTTITVYCSTPSNAYPVAANRDASNGYCKNNNYFNIDIIDGENVRSLDAELDQRRFAAGGALETDIQVLLLYILFGVDIQATFRGITEASRERTLMGETKFMLDNGIYFGAVNNRLEVNPIILLGVEDSVYSSTGIYQTNVTFVATRYGENANDYYMEFVMCLDRLDMIPMIDNYEELKANGYSPFSFKQTYVNATNRRQGYDERAGFRDVFYPVSEQDSSDNITVGASDYFWRGSAPSVAVWQELNQDVLSWNESHPDDIKPTIDALSYYLVALGYSRSSSSQLGLFTVNASASLGGVTAYNWAPFLSIMA